MRKLLILAAIAALSTACHNRSEDDTGAAPEGTDTTFTPRTARSIRTDSTMGQVPADTNKWGRIPPLWALPRRSREIAP